MAAPRQAGEGLPARRLALRVVEDVVRRRRPLDESFAVQVRESGGEPLSALDRGLARAIATATLRHLGSLRVLLGERLRLGVPEKSGDFEPAMWIGMAQIVFLDVPDHAAVDTTVSLIHEDRRAERYAGLANATLRRLAAQPVQPASFDAAGNAPGWLFERWSRRYGEATAGAIAAAQALEPTLDITAPNETELWAERLGALRIGRQTLRLESHAPVPELPGYDEGAWWVQDAAATLPALMLAAQPGERVLDLCAAPGGKTAQLAAAGARVTAVDRSEPRMRRLAENLARLKLEAEQVVADAVAYEAEAFDAVLLDAPCSATGTIRRHPDVAWTKTLEDVLKLAGLQRRLLDRAATLVRPGGRLVYATCSLEAEEGESQVAAFLTKHPGFRRAPVMPDELEGFAECIDSAGDVRALPSHLSHPQPRSSGLDGFYVARLIRVDGAG